MKVGFVSLGCSKNLIDTEVAIGKFKNHNFEIVNIPRKAEIIVINTCGFIDSAKEEAVNTILEMAEYKTSGVCKYLIVMGCLVQRYYDDLIKTLPEVDLFIKIEEYDKMWEKIEELIKSKEEENKEESEKEENKKAVNKKVANTKVNGKDVENGGRLKTLPMFMQREYLERTISTGKSYAYLKIRRGM